MQLDIDFEVFKELTALRESESDSYNAVIRRLLGISSPLGATADPPLESSPSSSALNLAGIVARPQTTQDQKQYGVWYGDVHLPEGTKFRATYKGQTHFGRIANGQWYDSDGILRTSPSDAAGAISKTNVNGWRFWHVQLPGDPTWRKLDELKS